MTKNLIALWATWPLFALNIALAQGPGSISGSVRDSRQSPVVSALVALHLAADSSLLKTVLSDSVGHFLFDGLKDSTYQIRVEATGGAAYRTELLVLNGDRISLELDPIVLNAARASQLQEVAVAAKKSLIVQRPDRTVVNVDMLLSAAGGTALDVLQKSPGIQVDQNGDISMKGRKGVMVYIDDRPSYLSGEDLANYLRSLPASSLDQVELMTNPPAQYEAAGAGGIINLRIKRSKMKGANGGLNLSIMQGKLTSSNNSANLNYRNNKLSAFANASYSLNNNFTDLDLNRVYYNGARQPEAYFEQNSYFRRHGDMGAVFGGADYSVSDKTTLGVVLTGKYRKSNQLNDNTSQVLSASRERDSTIAANNRDDVRFKNGAVNLNFRNRFDDKGHGLTADADYLTYITRTEQVYRNNSYLPDNTPLVQDVLNGHLPSRIDIYSLKADYTRPLPLQWQLAAGGKYSSIQTDNLADYRTTVDGVTGPDYGKSNQFIYTENIGAAYLNLNRELARLSVQAGLRFEHTASEGHQLGNAQKRDSLFARDYSNLFPTLYLTYKLDTAGKHLLNLNYGRRIARPYYQDLNPFLYPMDKFTYYTGNPFLKPSFIQSLDLSYTYNSKITASLSYSRSRDDVNETIEINNGIYYSRPANIGRKTYLTASLNAAIDPVKWLNANVYTEVSNIATESEFYNGTLKTSGTYWFIGGNVRVTAGKGWEGELSGDFRTRIYDAQFITGSFWQLNLGVQKKVSKAVTLKVAVNDIFYTQIIRGTITNLVNADAGWVNRQSSQTGMFTFTYRFGEAFKNNDRHEANGADAEKNRVKN